MRKTLLLAILIMVIHALSSPFAFAEELKTETIVTRITIPLSGNKTTLRFSVKNLGPTPVIVANPFVNETRLLVVDPDDTKLEVFLWKEGTGIYDNLAPGKEVMWDVDISQKVQFTKEGEYTISYSVNGKESNKIILVKGELPNSMSTSSLLEPSRMTRNAQPHV